jgi:hypothetical protein
MIYTAQSTNKTDVIAAISLANHGDTVKLPAGTVETDSQIYVNKDINLLSLGKTIIKGTEPNLNPLRFTTSNISPIQISGIDIQDYTGNGNGVALWIQGKNNSIKIDNCNFTNGDAQSIVFMGQIYGLVAHCNFLNDADESINVYYPDDSDVSQGDMAWSQNELLGTLNQMVIEDCTFIGNNGENTKGGTPIASSMGGRYTLRHCDIQSSRNYVFIDCHGNPLWNNQNARGAYSTEVYNNTITATQSYYAAYLRGGKGVFFNNTFSGQINRPITFADYNSFNINDYTDKTSSAIKCLNYPAFDQINNFYVWGNTLNGNPLHDNSPQPYVQDRGLERDHLQLNRDYFDNAMPGYTPLVYPHPLNTTNNGGFSMSIENDINAAVETAKTALETAIDNIVEADLSAAITAIQAAVTDLTVISTSVGNAKTSVDTVITHLNTLITTLQG